MSLRARLHTYARSPFLFFLSSLTRRSDVPAPPDTYRVALFPVSRYDPRGSVIWEPEAMT